MGAGSCLGPQIKPMTFSRRWLLLLSLGVVPLLLSGVAPGMAPVAAGWVAGLALLAGIDRARLPDGDQLTASRSSDPFGAVDSESVVTLTLRNRMKQPLRVEIRDTPPDNTDTSLPSEGAALLVPAESIATVPYTITPRRRGDAAFGDIYLRARSSLGLVQRLLRVHASAPLQVYPPLKLVSRFELMARQGRLQQMGIRQTRVRGAGREFESLRDYVPDDELRRIDWKATARRGKLVSREYQVERTQNVLLVLDLGRTMRAEVNGKQKLDYALEAALLLAHVAARSDDHVGLLAFRDEVVTWLPPRKSEAQVHAIAAALYNAEALVVEPDYRKALQYLRARWRRRSLVVCFTDLWDPDSSSQTIAELAALQPRHLAAAVTLLDSGIRRAARSHPEKVDDVYRQAVAQQLLDDRLLANLALTRRGVLVVDAPAEQLSAELVNRYLEVKARMRL